MKKAISAGLAALLLLSACSCSRPGNSQQTTSAAPAVTTSAVTAAESSQPASQKTDLSLLPEDFPSFPNGCKVVSTESIEYSPFKYPYTCDFTRIKVNCIKPQILLFSNSLHSLGWNGGIIFDDGTVTGHWCNDKHFITVSESEKYGDDIGDSTPYLLTLDVVKCENQLPEVLLVSFPAFTGGYTRNKGEYRAIDSYGDVINKFSGTFSEPNWLWDFRYEDAFFGVTRQEYEDYLKVLEGAGYGGIIQTESTKFGDIYYVSAERSVPNATNPIGVYLCYISYLSTLELIFSNDVTVFSPEAVQ